MKLHTVDIALPVLPGTKPVGNSPQVSELTLVAQESVGHLNVLYLDL